MENTDEIDFKKTHYVCMACRFESDKKNNCFTRGCPRYRNPLSECRCTDGNHLEIPRIATSVYAINDDSPKQV